MKLKIIKAVSVGLVSFAVGYGIGELLQSEPQSCNGLLQERANEAEQKMLMNNSDGGLYLLTKGPENNQVLFIGYVGPESSKRLRDEMLNAGLSKVHVETEGTCVSEGGLKYTVVTGSYVTAPQPDPL